MKRFFSTLALWVVLMTVATFFLANFFWNHPYRIALLLAVIFTFLTLAFLAQEERMDALEQRLKELEEHHQPEP